MATPLIPATILTGFLGSGKSTLLRRVLTEAHGRKIAVIENEFGEENIDSEIIVSGGDEQVIQLSNGCLRCGIRDDLRATLADLAERRQAGEIAFDQVMIETTGLADPGPIAQTFFLDPGFISKTDLVDDDTLSALRDRLRRMNSRAAQRVVGFGDVALDEMFDVRGFNLSPDLEFEPALACHEGHDHGAAGHAHHHHDDDVKSFVFRSERPFQGVRFGQFMNAIVKSHGQALLRYKGVLHMAAHDRRVIFQGVHQLMSHDAWAEDEARQSRLVFIGLDLPRALMTRSLQQCLV